MITKVKGEAIKEGSIPYSALATEVKEKIDKLVNITYANLKSLRDNSQLIPGQQYRIVDYTTTTTQTDTSTAGHQFDVIVTADDEKTLNENARACKSEFSIERYKDAIYREILGGDEPDNIYPVEYMGEFVYNGKKYYRYYIDAYSAEILIDWEHSASLQSITRTIDGYPEYKYWKTSTFIRRHVNGVWEAWNGADSEDIIVKNNIPNYSYFFNSDLNAWELKYCLDNDVTRFEWAQEIELSPVSKRKIIRVDNDEGYSYIYLRYPEGDENGEYAWVYDYGGDDDRIKDYVSRGEEDFDSDECIYTTTENPSVGYSIDEYNTVIEVGSTAEEGKGVIYYMKDEWNNECPYDFKNIMFRVTSGQSEYNYYTFHSLYGNYKDDTIENGTYGNVIKPYIASNRMHINNIRFGSGCYNNTFSYDCYKNTLGDICHSNSFGSDCYNNSFGYSCCRNNFGNYCNYNSFGPGCDNNSFGNYCYRNNFGSYCECNSFGNYCNYNSFGYQCSRNNFGNGCTDNSFGDYCSNNTFGNGCAWNIFGTSLTNLKSYYRYIIFDNGNSHINLNCTSTTSSSIYFQNVRIGLGVSGTSSIRKTISNSETNQKYETLYRAANSQTITI